MEAPDRVPLTSMSERDRIVKTLFSEKLKGTDTFVEQYITHVCIYEDVEYPASPPPRPTPPECLKRRYILVSVRSSGRLRLHKSRANDNGTFQIGKTWMLDDLQRIEDTGPRGLVISLQKPYFWAMDTPQDKMQFVNTLASIYKKYTGGRMFELKGFDERLLAPAHRSSTTSQGRQQPGERLPQRAPPLTQENDNGGARQPSIDYPGPRQQSLPLDQGPRRPSQPMEQQRTPQQRPPDLRNASVSSNYPTQTPSSQPIQSPGSAYSSAPQRIVSAGNGELMPPRRDGLRSGSLNIDTSNLMSPPPIEPRSRDRQRLGSPLGPTPQDVPARRVQAPIPQQMQLPHTPGGPPEGMRSPLSPPPAKSPARRPSNMSTASSDHGGIRTPREPMPRLPSKSGARESPLRPELPWNAPTPPQQSQPQSPEAIERAPAPRAIPPHVTTAMERSNSMQSVTTSLSAITASAEAEDESPDQTFGEEIGEAAFLEDLLADFKFTSTRGADAIAKQLQDELFSIETANTLAISEQDSRISDLMDKLDKGLAQCDEMSNTLTIYRFQLSSVAEHVRFIESQSQGLQVQTSNQKALIMEIDSVLSNIEISRGDVEVLQSANLDVDLRKVEKALTNFYRALRSMQEGATAIAATRGKGREYKQESDAFLHRLAGYVRTQFQRAVAMASQPASMSELPGHEEGYKSLFHLSPVMLYARDIAPQLQSEIRLEYASIAKSAWRDSILSFAAQWRSSVRQEPEPFAPPTRAAAIKRANTMLSAAGLTRQQTPSSSSAQQQQQQQPSSSQQSQQDLRPASEVFSIILDNLTIVITTEQNFLGDLFHLSSLQSIDYPDYVSLGVRNELSIDRLEDHRPTEPNRTLAKQRYELMEAIFTWLGPDLVNLADHFVKLDAIEVVGMLRALEVVEAEWSDSDQDWMLRMYDRVHDRLMHAFTRFVEHQCKLIKDHIGSSLGGNPRTRAHILPSFDKFPSFVERIEQQLASTGSSTVEGRSLDVRGAVDESYEMVTSALIASVRTAHANSATNAGTSSGNGTMSNAGPADEKDALAHHILTLCNLRQLALSIDTLKIPPPLPASLVDAARQARTAYTQHLGEYVRGVLSRPFGRLGDFVRALDGTDTSFTSSRPSLSPTALKRLLSDAPSDDKDIKKAVAALHKRVIDKHFEGVDPQLQDEVWRSCTQAAISLTERLIQIVQQPQFAQAGCRLDYTPKSVSLAFDRRGA
ncbi:GTP-Rho binding exocyst subunit [Savitreella phatthalungensis]